MDTNYSDSQKYFPFENPPYSPFPKGGNGSPPFGKGGREGFKKEGIIPSESEHIFENQYK